MSNKYPAWYPSAYGDSALGRQTWDQMQERHREAEAQAWAHPPSTSTQPEPVLGAIDYSPDYSSGRTVTAGTTTVSGGGGIGRALLVGAVGLVILKIAAPSLFSTLLSVALLATDKLLTLLIG